MRRSATRGRATLRGGGDGASSTQAEKERDPEKTYFDSYTYTSIHRTMIKDTVRTETYRAAILQNKHLFRDKVVLDVGCGTGILSLFSARAGARKVYGIEMSEMAVLAQKVVFDNKLDKIVEIIRGKVEEVEIPEKVDVIVSEWMGYCLFYESMLDSVLVARDKWLKPGGVILPDKVYLYLCGFSNNNFQREKDETCSYNPELDLNFSSLKPLAFKEPVIQYINAKDVITKPFLVKQFDLLTDMVEDIEIDEDISFNTTLSGTLSGIVAYFDVVFSQCLKDDYFFSTSPWSQSTHWYQTTFYFRNSFHVNREESIEGYFVMKKNKKHFRDHDIEIGVSCRGVENDRSLAQKFTLGF